MVRRRKTIQYRTVPWPIRCWLLLLTSSDPLLAQCFDMGIVGCGKKYLFLLEKAFLFVARVSVFRTVPRQRLRVCEFTRSFAGHICHHAQECPTCESAGSTAGESGNLHFVLMLAQLL